LVAFIALFLTIRSVSALNSIRMWTAMWVFFYGAYAYIKRGGVKYLWVVFLAVFIHFSYLLYSVPLVMAFVLKRRKLLIAALYVASLFVNVGFEGVRNLTQSVGLYEAQVNVNVLSEEALERRADEAALGYQKANFYKEFGPTIYANYSTVFLAFVLLFLYLRRIDHCPHLEFLIAGGLLLLALSNISAAFSPSISGRGITIAGTFLTAAAIQVLSLSAKRHFSKGTKRLVNLSFAAFFISAIPHLLFHVSYAINSASFFIITLPVFSWVIGEDDLSIRDFLC
jgi:hypothetical protein